MLSVLLVILPVFALILAGFLARRLDLLRREATSELNRFVVYLALPALLLDIVANAGWQAIWHPGFIAAFGLGLAIIFLLSLLLRRAQSPADKAIDGLNAAYGNTGYMGFPLALAVIGPASLVPTLVATILTVCILFAVALVLIEVGIQNQPSPMAVARQATLSLMRNPLLLAPVLGGLLLAAGLKPPGPVESFLKWLGAAASPCALVTLGLFLGEKRTSEKPDVKTIGLLVVLKLVVHPLVTALLALWVFRLPPLLAKMAILIAALPTGTGPFMLAEFYRREAGLTAQVILVSTIASLVTITACLTLIR